MWPDENYYNAKHLKFIWLTEEFAENPQLIIYARVCQVFSFLFVIFCLPSCVVADYAAAVPRPQHPYNFVIRACLGLNGYYVDIIQ